MTQTNFYGQMSYRTNAYTELATGMHYQENGIWSETREIIEPVSGGAMARYGPHKAIFAENLNSAGAIDLETPDGKRLRSHVLGLAYFDTASGGIVLIAAVRDSLGQVVGSNQVVYADAFTDLSADVRYTYSRAGFEQDIILRMQPPSPKEYGLDPTTTHLQVLTEFLDPPLSGKHPQTVTRPSGESFVDETLDFGAMKMGQGRAFPVGYAGRGESRVGKRWTTIEGRVLLIEAVPYSEIIADLQQLPSQASLNKRGKNSHLASASLRLPATPKMAVEKKPMLAAISQHPEQGYVLDYKIAAGGDGYTFKGDTTYYISGYVGFYGPVIFEGGTVIKYAPNASISITPGQYTTGSAVFLSASYSPAVFTAQDDDTVGETLWDVSTSLPNGSTYANPALYIAGLTAQTMTTVTNARFLYAKLYWFSVKRRLG
jgi:hypothetical protein